MNVLLLRLAGPMQSWGTQSRFPMRDTGLEPSKSGVIGLVCAAMGRRRWESISDLAALPMGVRVEREGKMESDYHTAMNVVKASGAPSKYGEAVLSHRFYLAGADFLVGLESEDVSLLKEIDDALQNPCWPLFLGRKAFPPGRPVHLLDGLLPTSDLHGALTEYPRSVIQGDDRTLTKLVIEDRQGEVIRVDQPGTTFAERRFAPRRVRIEHIPISQIPVRKEEPCISLC